MSALEIFSKGESLINIGRIPTKDMGRNHKGVEAVCNSDSLIFFLMFKFLVNLEKLKLETTYMVMQKMGHKTPIRSLIVKAEALILHQ